MGKPSPRIVTVKVMPDGRVATRKRFRVRRVDHRWRIECTYWNPVSGEWNSFVHVAFLWRVRSKAYAERVCRSHFRPAWNWWYETPERVRETARKAGVRVRLVKSEWKESKT